MATTTLTKGLALPARRTSGGYFAARNGAVKAWGDLSLAMLTPIGTRPMRRGFGSALYGDLFTPDGPQDDPVVDFLVRDAAARWCPHVVVTRVRSVPAGAVTSVHVAFDLAGVKGGL